MHLKYIPLDIFPTRCNITQFIYFWKTALHVSRGISTHHQEHIQLYLQYLVLVKRYCHLPILSESWSCSEGGVGILPICDVIHRARYLLNTISHLHIPAALPSEKEHLVPTRYEAERSQKYWHGGGGIEKCSFSSLRI